MTTNIISFTDISREQKEAWGLLGHQVFQGNLYVQNKSESDPKNK